MPRGIPSQKSVVEDQMRDLSKTLTTVLAGSPLPDDLKITVLLYAASSIATAMARFDPKALLSNVIASFGTFAGAFTIAQETMEIEKKREASRLKMQRRRAKVAKKKAAKKTAAPVKKAAVRKTTKKSKKR